MSFIYAGRLDELKGIKVLFEAWKMMGKDAPELMVCGAGPLEKWCNEHAQGLKIEMLGLIKNTEVKKHIAGSQALILPTLWYEGFPMTILESYSVGTPVICSNLGNAGSVVEENVTGWKFEPGNAKSLIEAIGRWQDIRDSVKKTYKLKYTPEVNYQQLINIYISAMKHSEGV